ncbi:MAG: S-layer homology domain-containing protein, partial [Pseudanabaenaceae cyanobacterium]
MSAWKSLYRCALSVFALVAALTPTRAIANSVEEMSLSTANHPVLRQVGALAEEQGTIQTVGELAQVTSVSQLSDVRPTDWAFTALQSLVERYGCIAGYQERMFQPPAMPSAPIRGLGQKTLAQADTVSVFRGQRSLTRFEFAAGVNA